MLTFTEVIKNEIIKSRIGDKKCVISFLSAYVHTCGSISFNGDTYGFGFVTENERTADYICNLFGSAFDINLSVSGAEYDIKSGRDKFQIDYYRQDCLNILLKLGLIHCDGGSVSQIFGIHEDLISDENSSKAYIKGAFLGGGSCTLPDEQTYSRTGYHLEIIFPNRIAAGDFADLLCEFEILAKTVSRKENTVIYAKSKEVISDILNVIGTEKCLKKLNRIVELKDRVNNDNRVNNCSVSNIDKALTASVSQIKAIEVISQTMGLQSLDANLFEVAEARLADKNASMQELADRLHITKSCINHRMRKIVAIASQLI